MSVKDARRSSEVVFEGTVVAMHESDPHVPVATFKVARVWKGNINETFEMPAFQDSTVCLGFLPRIEVGAVFLVYARRLVPSDSYYFPLPCETDLASNASGQIRALGRFRRPRKSK